MPVHNGCQTSSLCASFVASAQTIRTVGQWTWSETRRAGTAPLCPALSALESPSREFARPSPTAASPNEPGRGLRATDAEVLLNPHAAKSWCEAHCRQSHSALSRAEDSRTSREGSSSPGTSRSPRWRVRAQRQRARQRSWQQPAAGQCDRIFRICARREASLIVYSTDPRHATGSH